MGTDVNNAISKMTFWIERPHVLGLVGVKRPYDNLVVKHRVLVLFKEKLVDGHVQNGDDLLRVADELPVEGLVKVPHVTGVHVKVGRAKGLDLKGRYILSKPDRKRDQSVNNNRVKSDGP
jgi:hypothetical protein